MKISVLVLMVLPVSLTAQGTEVLQEHEHGTGILKVAVSGPEFTLSLAAPGVDIVGFEGPAATDDDRSLVAGAMSDLSRPLELFLVPENGGCHTVSANVALVDGAPEQGGEALGDGSDGAASHTEFQAEYLIHCQDIQAVDEVQFAYFDRFPNAQTLRVHIQSSDADNLFDVVRQTPMANLAGML